MNVDKTYCISENPFILAGNGNCIKSLKAEIKKGGLTLLWHPSWRISLKSLFKLFRISIYFRKNRSKFIICSNSPEEYRLCKLIGLNVKLFNQNMHECEHEFVPVKTEKKYDAIYIAQASPFKRMHLAKDINSLYILTYGCKNYVNEEGNDLSKFEPLINHATWNKSFIHNRSEISEIISQSHAGLALSKREGAMWASVQYFLCGIPLVTTKSKGGRDFFYDSNFVKIVNDNSIAVKNGIEYFKAMDFNPYVIRETTLKKIKLHRIEYLDFVSILIGSGGSADKEFLYDKIWGGSIGIKRLLYTPVSVEHK